MQNYITPVLISKFPEFLKDEYKEFYRFICDYFIFLEQQGNPLDILETFNYNCEPNNEVSIYVDLLLKELGFGINKPFTIPKSELILHLREFFLNRGNVKSFIFIFKVLFNETPYIDYPRKRLFILSNATYSQENYIFTLATSFGSQQYFSVLESPHFELKITGLVSGIEKSVEGITLSYHNNTPYLKIQIDDKNSQFFDGEGIKIENIITGDYIVETIGNVVAINILNRGSKYKVGDIITVSNCEIEGKAIVKTVTAGSVHRLSITNGGQRYLVGDTFRSGDISGIISSVNHLGYFLRTTNKTELQLEKSNFTIEFFITRDKVNIAETILCKTISPLSGWIVGLSGDNKVHLTFNNVGVYKSVSSIFPNKEYHIAIVKDETNLSFFINGVPEQSLSIKNGITSLSDLFLGNDYTKKLPFTGKIKNLKITKSVRYDSKFQPVALPYSNDPLKASVVLCLETNLVDKTGKVFTTNPNIFVEDEWVVFSGGGPITNLQMYCGGYNLTKIPSITINSRHGYNGVLTVDQTDIGAIKDIEIIEPFAFSSNPVITCHSTSGVGATFKPSLSSVFVGKKSFKTNSGFLGSHCHLLDSFYYQQFSYEIESAVPKKEFSDVVKNYLHPTGFVCFNKFVIQLDVVLEDLFQSAETEITWIKIIQDSLMVSLDFFFDLQATTVKNVVNPILVFNNINNIDWVKNFSSFAHQNTVFDMVALPDLNDSALYIVETDDIEVTIQQI